MIRFLDTSAILNGALNTLKNCFISPISLMELENIKDKKDKAESLKADARKAIRIIISEEDIQTAIFDNKLLDKVIKKYNFLSDINDHKILCAAELLGRERESQVMFYTSDGAQYTFAQLLPHLQQYYMKKDL